MTVVFSEFLYFAAGFPDRQRKEFWYIAENISGTLLLKSATTSPTPGLTR